MTSAWRGWRQPAETSGTTLAVLQEGVEKSTPHSTKGRPKLQPLALQKAPVTAEAGDSSGPSSASANGANGVLFSELMTAAQQSQTTADSARNPDVAPEEDSDQVDQDLAALAAATQIATRGVTLKPSTPISSSTEPDVANIQTIALDGATVDGAASDKESSTQTTDHDLRPQQDLQAIDGAELNVQALINIAMTAAITQTKDHPAAPNEADQPELQDPTASSDTHTLENILASEQVAELQEPAASKVNLRSETNLSSENEDHNGAVNLSTVGDVTTADTSAEPHDQTEAQHQTDLQSPKIAALQAVAWFDGAPRVNLLTEQNGASDETAQLDTQSGAPNAQTSLAEASIETSATHKDPLRAMNEPSAASTQQVEPISGQVEIGAQSAADADDETQASAENRKTDDADLAEAAEVAPLPLPVSILQPTQPPAQQELQKLVSDTPNSYAIPSGADRLAPQHNEHASKETPAFNLTTANSPTGMVDEPNQQSETATDRSGAANAALVNDTGLHAQQTTGVDSRDWAPVNVPATDATALEEELRQGKNDWTTNKTSPQDPNVRQSDLAELKESADANDASKIETSGKADINIREILKLGATDVTVSFAQPDLPAAPQIPAEQPLPPQASSNQQVTPQQAAPLGTTNVETNGEKRTIADDIRLRALERMVVNAARNGTQILSIQLYPPGLGQVVLRLAMDGQRLRLATRAATTEAADTLRNMEADLRDALAGNGLQLAGFDVSEDGPNDEAPRRQPVEPLVKTRSGGTKESFIVDLNA